MLKRPAYILLLLTLTVPLTASPSRTTSHRLGLELAGAYATNLYTYNAKPQGAAANLGVLYELQHRHFLFHTSLAAQYNYLLFTLPDQQTDLNNVIDDDGDLATIHLKLRDNRASDQTLLPRLSIMMGGDWQSFYFLLGGNIGLSMYHACSCQTTYSTSSNYDFFKTELINMPQHGLVTAQQHTSSSRLTSSLNANAAVELGTSFRSDNRKAPVVRLALFGEYALTSFMAAEPQFTYQSFDYSNLPYAQLTDKILSSFDQSANNYLQQSLWGHLTIGIKLSILFNLRSSSSYRCMCLQ